MLCHEQIYQIYWQRIKFKFFSQETIKQILIQTSIYVYIQGGCEMSQNSKLYNKSLISILSFSRVSQLCPGSGGCKVRYAEARYKGGHTIYIYC
jgi:hypothetical protein